MDVDVLERSSVLGQVGVDCMRWSVLF